MLRSFSVAEFLAFSGRLTGSRKGEGGFQLCDMSGELMDISKHRLTVLGELFYVQDFDGDPEF